MEQQEQKKKRGGPRPNSGRPKGSVDPLTKAKLKAEKRFKSRIFKLVDRLVDDQLALAQGISHLFRVDEIKDSNEKVIKREHVLVTDPEEIREFLDSADGFSSATVGDDQKFYYITTKDPDNFAINSLMDRAFGRPAQAVEIGGKDGGAIVFKIGDYQRTVTDETGDDIAEAV